MMMPYLVMADPDGAPWWPKVAGFIAASSHSARLNCHVRVGLELPLHQQIATVLQPPPDMPNVYPSYSAVVPFTPWAGQLRELVAAVPNPLINRVPRGPVVRPQGDLVVMSHIDEQLANELAARLQLVPDVWLAGHVNLNSPVVWKVAWNNLLTVGVFTDGAWLQSVHDGDELGYEEVDAALQKGFLPDAPSTIRFGFSDEGRVLNFVDALFLAPEYRFIGRGLPRLPHPDRSGSHRRPVQPTIQQRAIEGLTGKTRPAVGSHPMDDSSAVAWFSAPTIARQLPDVSQVFQKVHRYCLDPEHPQGKYQGFASLGYEPTVEHARLLGYQLLSAVLQEEATPTATRITSDGTLQFEVRTLISGPQRAAAVLCGWNQQATKALQLSTAYVITPKASRALSPAMTLPATVDTDDFRSVIDAALMVGEQAGARIAAEFSLAIGFLVISHSDDRSAAFGRWLRRNRNAKPARTRRGNETRFSPKLPFEHADELEVALINAATVLNLAGISASHEVVLI